jgi:hypothetical protein
MDALVQGDAATLATDGMETEMFVYADLDAEMLSEVMAPRMPDRVCAMIGSPVEVRLEVPLV